LQLSDDWSLEVLVEFGSDVFGRDGRSIAFQDLSIAPDEELGEVPADVLVALFVRVAALEIAVGVTGAVPVDLDLREHREVDVVLRTGKLEDLFVRSGLLAAKLIAREAKNVEATTLVLFVKGTQTCVLAGEASTAREVDDQADGALVVCKALGLARDRSHLEIMKAGHCFLLDRV
jgi:hypothetical protein